MYLQLTDLAGRLISILLLNEELSGSAILCNAKHYNAMHFTVIIQYYHGMLQINYM
ncbi:hypothetical protein [Bacillus cereus]|uniref:hypothetical protein n=1 Tax=Bacillus cereus group TaxID=86661 RepID=UPI001595F2A4|nr:hypothetical protein [Bacillus cereus]